MFYTLLHVYLMIVGGVLSFFAVALSALWQWLDAAADGTTDKVHAEVGRVLAQGYRPAETSEAEERALLFKRIARVVRPVGVLCLYGGIALIALGCMAWGFNALDAGVPQCPR